MTCDKCKTPGKRFTIHPSKQRLGFIEQLCKKCSALRVYETERLEQAKRMVTSGR